jgi:hypothetical protein
LYRLGKSFSSAFMNFRKVKSSKPTPKWLLVLLGLAVLYIVAQPLANRQLGWNLPSLGSLLPDRPAADPDRPDPDGESDTTAETKKKTGEGHDPTSAVPPSPSPRDTAVTEEAGSEVNQTDRSPEDSGLLYGVLRSLGREEYVSAEGLRYTRGSAEGHRLKHLERHLNDQPDRSGRHGVFDGDMAEFLTRIDQAYARGKQRATKTTVREEDGRTIYEATFEKSIGYVGGREGARLGRPTTHKLRLVTEDDRVITAFPF